MRGAVGRNAAAAAVIGAARALTAAVVLRAAPAAVASAAVLALAAPAAGASPAALALAAPAAVASAAVLALAAPAAGLAAAQPAPTDSAAADTASSRKVVPLPEETMPHFEPVPDRWRDVQPPPYELNVDGRWYDPYNRNTLKGDYPIAGQNTFLVFTGILDNRAESATAPTPSGISTRDPGSDGFFGGDGRFFYSGTAAVTLELYHGQTAFRPRDWEFKVTGAFNLNRLRLDENNNVNINVRKGNARNDDHFGFKELSFEKHLLDVSERFDFLSVRLGIQKFGSDFRNLVFKDDNLGVRLFGTAGNNRYQYNLAYFDLLEKDTNSDLNTVFERRGQQVLVANLYRQDTFTLGYTTAFNLLVSRDHGEPFYNTNGVPVRPPVLGAGHEPQEIDAVYLGWTGDGHFGRLNVDHAFYYVTGSDEHNPISGRVDVAAWMAALELSVDKDWQRYRVSAVAASGDSDPYDDAAGGFDAVADDPFFAGGSYGWWTGQEIRLNGVNLVNKRSFLPTLRPGSKFESQANFVNPGFLLFNLGYDAELTPKLESLVNVSYLGFMNTSVLEAVLNQPGIGSPIGVDASLGVIWRPFLNNNVIVDLDAAVFAPLSGFNDIYESPGLQYQALAALVLTY
jgi:hypothetical protein